MLTRLGSELRWGQALELFLELQLAGGQCSSWTGGAAAVVEAEGGWG